MPKIHIKYLTVCALFVLLCAVPLAIKISPVKASDAFLVEPANPEESTTRDQRVAERKAAFTVQIDQQSVRTLAARCEKTQKVLVALKDKDAKVLTARHDTYTNSVDKLNFIIKNLKSRNINSTAMEISRQQFIVATNKYIADAGNYKTALDDLAQLDCSKDLTGFKATILSARQLRSQLAVDVKNVKATYTQVKSAVDLAKQALSASKAGN